MKLTILTENIAGSDFRAEHGLSYLIETGNDKILFDTGNSDLFIRNAEKIGISIQSEIEKIVLSHGHWDHGNGLSYLKNKTLITHPSSFFKRYRKRDQSFVGLNQSIDEIEKKYDLIKTRIPYQVTENLLFLGEIPRLDDFESRTTEFINENGDYDFIPDDSALVAIIEDQIIVITGCSHSGICNICEHAKKVTGLNKIKAVIGGFHLRETDQQTQKTIEYFKKNNAEQLFPSHCTGLPVLAEFNRVFKINAVKAGMSIVF